LNNPCETNISPHVKGRKNENEIKEAPALEYGVCEVAEA
jgi:hypothetical protein